MISIGLILWFPISLMAAGSDLPTLRIGSKNFTESYILAEILAQKIEAAGIAHVERRLGLGGTGILHSALKFGEIDVYPEYSGTLSMAILHGKAGRPLPELKAALAKDSILISEPLGINNSYGLAVTRAVSEREGLTRISQLKDHPLLRMAFSYEFMERKDGYRALLRHYKWKPKVSPVRMDHALVYSSLAEGKSDVIEVYTTDSKIGKMDLVVLRDDREFFPDYEGLYLYRQETRERCPELEKIFAELSGTLTNSEMIRLNGLVEIQNLSYAEAARSFIEKRDPVAGGSQYWTVLWSQTKRHLLLVLVPTLISMLIGIPLGVIAAKVPRLGQTVLGLSGLIQTIPSLALLCFLIPVFGIGLKPALVALILYGLLPIVRSTHGGISAIERRHIEVARVLGLNWRQQLLRIEFPLAATHIFGGVKTAAIINVGMSTLAAFIGAGGYGALIVTGLSLNDTGIILQGALPAAAMALIMHFIFEMLDRWFIPQGLKY